MRTDVKIGIAVGILVLLGVVVYLVAIKPADQAGNNDEVAAAPTGTPEDNVVRSNRPTPVVTAAPTPVVTGSPVPVVTGGPVAPPSPAIKAYKIEKVGTTFTSIAKEVYGDGKYWKMIADANPSVSSGALRPGMTLTIPPAPVEVSMSPGTPGTGTTQPSGDKYTVKAGDTLTSIAAAQLGGAKYQTLIAKLNPTVDPNKLRLGQVLNMPPKPSTAVTPVAGGTTPPTPAILGITTTRPAGETTGRSYTVQVGDTLHGLSEKFYGSTKYWPTIVAANPNVKNNTIIAGQTLVIPPLADHGVAITPSHTSSPSTPTAPIHATASKTGPADDGKPRFD